LDTSEVQAGGIEPLEETNLLHSEVVADDLPALREDNPLGDDSDSDSSVHAHPQGQRRHRVEDSDEEEESLTSGLERIITPSPAGKLISHVIPVVFFFTFC
jgi:hypothetical protein